MIARAALVGLAFAATAVACARREPNLASQRRIDFRDHLRFEAVGPLTFDRAALARGPTVIIFFATWCMPCLGQLQYLAALQREYGERGLNVVGIGMDLEGWKVLQPFAMTSEYPFPILLADDALIRGESAFGRIRELPSVLVIDRKGDAVGAWTGFAEPRDVRDAVEALVEANEN